MDVFKRIKAKAAPVRARQELSVDVLQDGAVTETFGIQVPDGVPGRARVTFDRSKVEGCLQQRHGEPAIVFPLYGNEIVICDRFELDAEYATKLIQRLVHHFGGQHSVVL